MDLLVNQIFSPDRNSFEQLNQLVIEKLGARNTTHQNYRRHYYDTFDWRLYKAGYLLEVDATRSTKTIRLREIGHEIKVLEQTITQMQKFADKFPPGKLRELLCSIIKERALMAYCSADIKSSLSEILDNKEKILLRIRVESVHKPGTRQQKQAINNYLRLYRLKGYDKPTEKIQKKLIKRFNFKKCTQDPSVVLFKIQDIKPNSYSSKLDVRLDPDMPSHQALSMVLMDIHDTMQKNIFGILQDIDPEFLHDFRIAGRRSRTLINQVKGVYAKSTMNKFQNTFCWLSKITSTPRDLDVFLFEPGSLLYQSDNASIDSLEPLRIHLKKTRQHEYEKLNRALKSKRFAKFNSDWQIYLQQQLLKPARTPFAKSPILIAANTSIWRNYKRMLKHGHSVKEQYDYLTIHELRKTGKKLRYLLEAFRSLYPEVDLVTVIKHLKKFQNSLGKIVDLHTQRDLLQNWVSQMPNNTPLPQETLNTITDITGSMIEQEEQTRKTINKSFDQFDSKSIHKLFKQMFHSS